MAWRTPGFFTHPSPMEKGLGLGLALVKNLVEENKGRIELVESSKGAHFKLSLPKF